MPEEFKTEQWVPYPNEFVFGFFANPRNLALLTPEQLGMRIEKLELAPPPANLRNVISGQNFAGVGTEMKISFRPVPFLPLRTGWIARISEFAWFSYFCDEQIKGPFKSFRHCHRFCAETKEGVDGTRVADEVEFSLPLGAMGLLANWAVLAQMRSMFRVRQERLASILEAKARGES